MYMFIYAPMYIYLSMYVYGVVDSIDRHHTMHCFYLQTRISGHLFRFLLWY